MTFMLESEMPRPDRRFKNHSGADPALLAFDEWSNAIAAHTKSEAEFNRVRAAVEADGWSSQPAVEVFALHPGQAVVARTPVRHPKIHSMPTFVEDRGEMVPLAPAALQELREHNSRLEAEHQTCRERHGWPEAYEAWNKAHVRAVKAWRAVLRARATTMAGMAAQLSAGLDVRIAELLDIEDDNVLERLRPAVSAALRSARTFEGAH